MCRTGVNGRGKTVTPLGRCRAMRNDTGMRRGIVLVVDDDPSLLGIMRPLLEAQGYRVVSTTDCEVVNIARTVHPGVIFLEVQRSGIDGVTLSHRLRHDAVTSH